MSVAGAGLATAELTVAGVVGGVLVALLGQVRSSVGSGSDAFAAVLAGAVSTRLAGADFGATVAVRLPMIGALATGAATGGRSRLVVVALTMASVS